MNRLLRERGAQILSALIALSVVAAMLVAVVAITGNSRQSDHTAASVEQIQAERERNVLVSCEDVNERHDNTIVQLDALLAKARKTATPKELEEMEQNRTGTVLLLEAIVPKRDCKALVRRSVGDE